MRSSISWANFTKCWLGFVLAVVYQCAFAVSPSVAVEQLVMGTKIKDVSLAPLPHSNAIRLSIETSAGQKHIILAKNQVHAALSALKNPHITGKHNAMVSTRIIHQNQALAQFVTPAKIANPPQKMALNQPTKALPTPSAAAIATMTAVSSNQQASR